MKAKHPMQPIYIDDQGRPRFKENQIVKYLRDKYSVKNLLEMPFSNEDRSQFIQLTGCSVCFFGEVSFTDPKQVKRADDKAERLTSRRKKS